MAHCFDFNVHKNVFVTWEVIALGCVTVKSFALGCVTVESFCVGVRYL